MPRKFPSLKIRSELAGNYCLISDGSRHHLQAFSSHLLVSLSSFILTHFWDNQNVRPGSFQPTDDSSSCSSDSNRYLHRNLDAQAFRKNLETVRSIRLNVYPIRIVAASQVKLWRKLIFLILQKKIVSFCPRLFPSYRPLIFHVCNSISITKKWWPFRSAVKSWKFPFIAHYEHSRCPEKRSHKNTRSPHGNVASYNMTTHSDIAAYTTVYKIWMNEPKRIHGSRHHQRYLYGRRLSNG